MGFATPVPAGPPSVSSSPAPAGFAASEGFHNSKGEETKWRIIKGGSYRDCSTIIVLPTPTDFIHNTVEAAIDGLIKPMNQRVVGPIRLHGKEPVEKIKVVGCEVGDAYNQALSLIAGNPGLADYRFMLTIEHDNLPPPDGLTRLLARMYDNADKDDEGRVLKGDDGILKFHFLGIGGAYWTKGESGQIMCYGNPKEFPVSFRPQNPIPDALQECNGIAMGFTLWNLSALLNDKRLGPPWYETVNSFTPGVGVNCGTQDLVFCGKALKFGYRFAVDMACKVGHLDLQSGLVW